MTIPVGIPGGGATASFSARARWHRLANLPTVTWLVALLVVAVAHRFIPLSTWLMVHIAGLGAMTNAVVVWSQHFADAVLRRPTSATSHRDQVLRLVGLNTGIVLLGAGMLAGIWWLTLTGALAVAAAVAAHGTSLALQIRRAVGARHAAVAHYYVAAAWCMPLVAGLGAAMAHPRAGTWLSALTVSHATIALTGLLGLTVVGTLITLWPTMLRTRMADGALTPARHVLPLFLAAEAAIFAAGVGSWRWLYAAGLAIWLVALLWTCRPLIAEARVKPPSSFATWSVAASTAWLAGCLTWLALAVASAGSWHLAADRLSLVTGPLIVGFALQILLGSLSYLVPVVIGGGPTLARRTTEILDHGAVVRVTITNLGLLAFLATDISFIKVMTSLVVMIALAWFLPLLWRAIAVAVRSKRPASPEVARSPRRRWMPQALAGAAVVLLSVAAGIAADPHAAGLGRVDASSGIVATGNTTRVEVSARDMRFTPSRIDVPAGDRLIIVVTNTDPSMVHDLVLASGQSSGRIEPGGTAEIEVPVVGTSIDGWCSIAGHRQMGMTLQVVATGAAAPAGSGDAAAHGDHAGMADGAQGTPGRAATGAAADLDLMREPSAGFTPYDPVLPPAPVGKHHRVTLTVTDELREVAPGVRQLLWTFNGSTPGPTLRGKVGDTFEVTLVNNGTMGHSIDFHAGILAPDEPMRTIPPGESLVYRFTAKHSGIWMYHCSTVPMSHHIANGMYGAVIIDPPDLPAVDKEYVLVQGEYYLGEQEGVADAAKVAADAPDLVVFNGYARGYVHAPLSVRSNERIRIWVLNAGPNRDTSFHVVGGQFDTVFREGAYDLRPGNPEQGGAQALFLGAAQGGFVELALPEPGHYTFVDHHMSYAEKGAAGVLKVSD